MTEYFDKPVAYLEIQDFDKNTGNLINNDIPKDIPVVIMLQSSWCNHCKKAKPKFQEFANATKGHVFCATIQADGERKSENALGEIVKTLKSSFRGFPDYLLYVNGKRVEKEVTGRDVKNLREFAII